MALGPGILGKRSAGATSGSGPRPMVVGRSGRAQGAMERIRIPADTSRRNDGVTKFSNSLDICFGYLGPQPSSLAATRGWKCTCDPEITNVEGPGARGVCTTSEPEVTSACWYAACDASRMDVTGGCEPRAPGFAGMERWTRRPYSRSSTDGCFQEKSNAFHPTQLRRVSVPAERKSCRTGFDTNKPLWASSCALACSVSTVATGKWRQQSLSLSNIRYGLTMADDVFIPATTREVVVLSNILFFRVKVNSVI